MQPTSDRVNNFDFLRVSAALAVLVSHQYALTGRPEPVPWVGSWGGLGVLVFFAVSGFLVAGSWLSDPNLLRFTIRRWLRIWPGLAVATLGVVFVLGPLVTALPKSDYFSASSTWSYLKLLGLWEFHEQLPGIFSGNAKSGGANGSLWTIPVEVRCYVALAMIGVLGILRQKMAMTAMSLALYGWFFFFSNIGYDNPLRAKLQMGIVFLAAAQLYQLRSFWMHRKFVCALCAWFVAWVAWVQGLQEISFTLGLPIFVILLGSWAAPILKDFGRFGDISYGLYIYAFPVQQTVIWIGGPSLDFLTGLAISIGITMVLAWLSWHWIEYPALQLKGRLNRGSRSFAR